MPHPGAPGTPVTGWGGPMHQALCSEIDPPVTLPERTREVALSL
jgi:hypothetical protein